MDQNWERMKGQITTMWEGLDEKALKKTRGSLPDVVSLIHEHTGEEKAMIMTKMQAFI